MEGKRLVLLDSLKRIYGLTPYDDEDKQDIDKVSLALDVSRKHAKEEIEDAKKELGILNMPCATELVVPMIEPIYNVLIQSKLHKDNVPLTYFLARKIAKQLAYEEGVGNIVQVLTMFAELLKQRNDFYAGRVVAVGLDTIDNTLAEVIECLKRKN